MKVVVGLGNPGVQYQNTRHNAGFWVIDALSRRWSIPTTQCRHRAKLGVGLIRGTKAVLVKPQTFMNRSGEAVRAVLGYYKVELDDFLVVVDDLALEPGRIRLRGRGSSGGHNGLADIIRCVGSSAFPRLRIGIGSSPPHVPAADFVLAALDAESRVSLCQAVSVSAEAVESWLATGLAATMSEFNRVNEQPSSGA